MPDKRKRKIKILRTIRKQYAIAGIAKSTGPSNRTTKFNSFNKRILMGYLMLGGSVVAQIVYIFHVASGFMEYVNSICSIASAIIIFVCFAAIALRKITLFKNIKNLEKLINSRSKHSKSGALFLKTNRQVERASKMVFVLVVKVALQCFMLPKFIASIITYLTTDLGPNSFQLSYPMWFPFDTNNPIGYLIAIAIEYIILAHSYHMIACALSLGIGAYWFAISISNEFQNFLRSSINDRAQSNENQTIALKILFSEFIGAHGMVKRVEHDFSNIFQPIIMTLFTWSILAISAAMLVVQIEIVHHGNVMTILLLTTTGIIALAVVFIACEIGQRMADAFEEASITIDQLDWYLFPSEIKRVLPLIIAIAQQPVTLECFGSIACTRDVFKNINHRAYSYSMVLRQLGE